MTDVYVNSDQADSLIKDAGLDAKVRNVSQTYETVSGDNDDDVKRLFSLPANARPFWGVLGHDIITGATDVDLGVYYPNGGAVVSADCLVNGANLTSGSRTLDALSNVDIKDLGNMELWEIAGLTSNPGGNLDVALTLNTAGSGAASINVFMNYKLP